MENDEKERELLLLFSRILEKPTLLFFFLLWTTPLLFINCGELLLGYLLLLLPLLLLFSPRRIHFKWKRMATSDVVWWGREGAIGNNLKTSKE
jgi:hypothetical protein